MISHHHRCVFIHIPKTAGQSIEHVFLTQLGLTWKTREALLLRRNDRPDRGPPRLAHLKWHEYVSCNHMTQEQFEAYFKFAFVRDPWARVVSMYRYLGFDKRISFREFVLREFRGRIWRDRHWFVAPQSDFICDPGGRPMVDFVGRFENLEADFNSVCQRLGMPLNELPHVNASRDQTSGAPSRTWLSLGRGKQHSSPRPATFQDYYDEETCAAVARLYRRDVEIFGYTPPV
ncbi:sulfotransferase family protein [Oricola sp.]|uniref:sulfotransferase family protein n=1 Tax=Oricola sp. TaxID=1979950 RepID=UPI0025DF3DFB|nr:sulfotransferase family protein [Oricola sp.]MCI5077442.1 sulfotransferase family protein [Oricola sp.]